MARVLKWTVFALSGALAIAVLAGVAVAAWLVLPGRPSAAKSLAFQGYMVLPSGPETGPLRIMDYMTVSGRNLFVGDESTGNVYRADLDSRTAGTAKIAVFRSPPAAHGVAIDPTSHLAFVSRSETNSVDVFDPDGMRLVKRIPVAEDVDGIFYDPFHKLIYAVNGDPHLATLIDPASQTKVGEVPLGGKPEFAAVDPVTRLLYQNLEDVNAVAAVDLGRRAVVQRWPLAGCQAPTGMALDAVNRRLFVVCSANARLVVFDLDRHVVTAALPIGGGPDAVAYDPDLRRIYATGKPGILSVTQQLGPDRYQALDLVRMHYGAHTLAVDPQTHRVFVAYASLLAAPRLAVFAPRP